MGKVLWRQAGEGRENVPRPGRACVSQAAGRYSAPEQSPEETSECVLFGWKSILGKEQHLQTAEVGACVAHFRKDKEIGGPKQPEPGRGRGQ